MRFNDRVNLDPSQVQDRRGGGMPGGGIAVGGGAGVIILLISLLLGFNPSDIASSLPNTQQQAPASSSLSEECRVGADANVREDCRLVGFVNSIQAYWDAELPKHNLRYEPAKTTFFEDMVQTGCGVASSAVGPFYCPEDQQVYLDLGFFGELQRKYGARGGPFAQAYVLAHEYGHHVQHLIGTFDHGEMRDSGPQSKAVRVELQADCFAGVWARQATATGYLEVLTDADIADGLNAAAAIGDDRLQQRAQGRVSPEKWTHGSSEQRQRWFTTGYRGGDPTACDTFSGRV